GTRPRGHAQGVRGARLAPRRRLPDPQPDPPRARVPDEGRARDRRRPPHPPARRRDEVGRRSGCDPRRVLPRPRRGLLPGRPRDRHRIPGGDALRGPARGYLACNLPQELRLLALHRRPRPRRRRRLLRHVRRAAHLRRVRAARARHRADVLRARVLVQRLRLDGDSEDVPARRRRPRLPVRDEGARAARRGPAAAGRVLAARGRRGAHRRVPMTWQFTLTGLFIGSLVGLTGMGGGSLMTPILILLFGFQPTLAVGTDILHGAVFKSFGAVRHRNLGNVHARITFWMFLGSAPMSLVGVELANWIEAQYGSGVGDAMARGGAALILGGLGFLAKTFIKRGVQPSDAPFLLSNRDRVICVALGASGGFLVGLTSVGSGTFFGLVMLLVFPLTAAKIVGTDIFHA